MHGEHAAQAIGLFVNWVEFRVAQRPRQAVGRQHRTDHAVIFDDPAQLGDCGWHILHRQNGDAFQARLVAQEAIVQIIVVSPAQIHREVGHADLADMHEAGRINHRGFEPSEIQRLLPILQRGDQE